MSTLMLSYSALSATIDVPELPYESEIHMGVHVIPTIGKGYKLWDDGAVYDYRVCKCRFVLSQADMDELLGFYHDCRDQTLTLNLGATATGFFPFGPDKGDLGSFTVRLDDLKQSGRLFEPLDYFSVDVAMLMVTAPAYSLTAPTADEGGLHIGTCYGVHYPQNGPTPEILRDFGLDITRGGSGYFRDASVVADRRISAWTQRLTENYAAELAVFLTGASGRASDITIVSDTNYWLFGMADSGESSSGTHTCKLINGDTKETVLVFRHTEPKWWEVDLKFWQSSVA